MLKKFFMPFARISVCVLLILYSACTNQAPVTGSCKAELKGDLWNCDKSDCSGKCMLQVRNPGDTVWKDIPGGNLNDSDLKEKKQDVRCDCRKK